MDLDTSWLTGMYVLGLVTGVTVTLFFVIVAIVLSRRDEPRGLDTPEFNAALDRVEWVVAEREAIEIAAAEEEYAERRAQQMEQGFRTVFAAEFEAEEIAAWAWSKTGGEDEA